MVKIRKMRPDELPGFVAYFVPDYAAEISSNYDMDMESALAKAEAAVADDLGQGVETLDQDLLCVTVENDKSDAPVGYIWCKTNIKDRSIFIGDFYIFPKHRGQGFGLSALLALEATYSRSAYNEIKLRVAADNKSAERLYLRAGYRPTGINMRRAIGGAET